MAYFVFTQLQYLKSLPLSLYSMRLDLWSFWKSMNHLKELNQYESLVTNSFLLLLVRHMLLLAMHLLLLEITDLAVNPALNSKSPTTNSAKSPKANGVNG